MRILGSRTTKLTALALVLAMTQVYVHADLVKGAGRAPAGAAAQGRQGRLTTRGNNPVSVNGNSARTGETVFSGQQIQTPGGVGATVQLGDLGRLDLAPNTTATLTFEDGRVNVSVASGCVILTANRGVAGTVEAGGTSQQTDAAQGGTIDICTNATPGAAPIVGQGAAAAAGAGAGSAGAVVVPATAGTVATGGGLSTTAGLLIGGAGIAAMTTAAIVVPCRRGRNPSPGTPRGRNDECR